MHSNIYSTAQVWGKWLSHFIYTVSFHPKKNPFQQLLLLHMTTREVRLCEHTARRYWQGTHLTPSLHSSLLITLQGHLPALQFVYLFLHLYTPSFQNGFGEDDTIVIIIKLWLLPSCCPSPRAWGGGLGQTWITGERSSCHNPSSQQ